MTSTPSTAYSRDLGDELRLIREACSTLNGRKFAIQLGWDPSKVSNIEHGKARASEIDLVQFLTACGKDFDFYENFRQRYRYAFDEYVVQVSGNLRTVAMAESTATEIITYDAQTMPGLLQTPEYADGIYRMTGMVTEERIPTLVQFRTERQTVLRRHDRPTCLFFVHEHALQLQVGSSKIMEDQYARLLFDTHKLRIVPADAPIAASSCMLWEFEKAHSVVYSETDLTRVFVQDPGAIARARLLFDRLDQIALSAEQSRRRLAEYVSQVREDRNGGAHLA